MMKQLLSVLLAAALMISCTVSGFCAATKNNVFSLDPTGEYILYAYNPELIGYTNLGYAYMSTHQVDQAELDAAVAAINALPNLSKASAVPIANAEYGLMSVAMDEKRTKTQYYLFPDVLTVNGTGYSITTPQYNKLKAVMANGAASDGGTVPFWFAYMNPNRVKSISCTNTSGVMKKMKTDNVSTAATALQYIHVKEAKTYKPGSKKLDSMPFKAVYTFDNNVTYTVYVSDTTSRKNGVTIYVESSEMTYACQYTVDGYISSFVQSTQGMIDGPADPMTM